MNVKELIAKIHISHILCISAGVLIPIYVDVLVFHGFDSSTVSAMMDTVVAGSAFYAAWSVRNWITDRVKNKGYELAEKILLDVHALHIMNFKILRRYIAFGRVYMDGEELNDNKTKNMISEVEAILEDIDRIEEHIIKLTTSIYTLQSWSMVCNAKEQYLKLCRTTGKALSSLEDLMSLSTDPSALGRKKSWNRKKGKTDIFFKIVKKRYTSLEIRFENIFSYKPVTKNIKAKDKK